MVLLKVLLLPFIPLVFAYLELGGNWFGLRLLEKGPTVWSVVGTIVFSVLYSLVSAYFALKLQVNLPILMVMYGFGFSIVSIFLILEWGKLPSFTSELINQQPLLWLIAFIASVGFLASAYVLLRSS